MLLSMVCRAPRICAEAASYAQLPIGSGQLTLDGSFAEGVVLDTHGVSGISNADSTFCALRSQLRTRLAAVAAAVFVLRK